jgi:signal peptidase I
VVLKMTRKTLPMSERRQHRQWVGLLLGFLISGASHFLSGDRASGVKWFVGLFACSTLFPMLMAIPGNAPFVVGLVVCLVTLALWLVMLKQSYRPVQRMGIIGWLMVVILASALNFSASALLGLCVRTFKIPTGAMHPTLRGITGAGMSSDNPNRPGLVNSVITGRRFREIRATTEGTLTGPNSRESTVGHAAYSVGSRVYLLPKCARPRKGTGAHIKEGDILWSGVVTAGDHVFVERLSYRFRSPKRGDIVVFSTDGIMGLPQNTCYIKRIVGLPGERVGIAPPFLTINGDRLTTPAIFQMISNKTNGYSGFQCGGKLVQGLEWPLGEDEYFVLGDNTRNSRDSRYWGPVPEKNIIGKVTRIYWPLSRINALEGK